MAAASKYKSAYCNEIIECLGRGYSVSGFAGYIGVATSSVHLWIKNHPEFAEAYAIAKGKSAYHWETKFIEFAQTGKNVGAFAYALGNRCPEEWKNVQKFEHAGKDGGPIETVTLTMADRVKALAAFMAKTKKDGGE